MARSVPTFSVCNWKTFQHYNKPKPPWIKLYRELLGNFEFMEELDETERWHVIGLWLLAAETGNKIPLRPEWLKKRLGARNLNLEKLEVLGFVSLGDSTRDSLERVYTKTETETETEVETENENARAEKLSRPTETLLSEGMGLVEKHWWGAGDPPGGRDPQAEASIWRQLAEHFGPEELNGAIAVAPRVLRFHGPTSLKLFRSKERGWPLLNQCIGEWRKTLPTPTVIQSLIGT